MKRRLVNDVPDGLTRRTRYFVSAHGIKVDVRPVAEFRQWWLDREVPSAVIDRGPDAPNGPPSPTRS